MHVLLCQWLIALKTFFRPAGAVEGGEGGRKEEGKGGEGVGRLRKGGGRGREREGGRGRRERERGRDKLRSARDQSTQHISIHSLFRLSK